MATIYAENDGSVGGGTVDWDNLHDASSAKGHTGTATHDDDAIRIYRPNSSTYHLWRVFMTFDTSGISSAPSEATLEISLVNQHVTFLCLFSKFK